MINKEQEYRENFFIILNNFREFLENKAKETKDIKRFLDKIPKEFWKDNSFCLKMNNLSTLSLIYIDRNCFENYEFFLKSRYIKAEDLEFIVKNISKEMKEKLFGDKDFMSKLMNYDINNFKYAAENLKNDKELVKSAFSGFGIVNIENIISENLLKDKDFIIELVNENVHLLKNKKMMNILLKDITEEDWSKKWFSLVRETKGYVFQNFDISKLSEDILENYLDSQDPYFNIFKANKNIKLSMNFLKYYAKSNFKSLPLEYKSNEEIVRYVIKHNPRAWVNLPDKWKNNREICLSVVKEINIWGDLIPALKGDHEIIFEHVFMHMFNQRDLETLKEIKPEMFGNKNFANMVISRNSRLYPLFDENIRRDQEIIDKVVRDDEYHLIDRVIRDNIQFNLDLINRKVLSDPMGTISNQMLYKEEIIINLISKNPSVIPDYLMSGSLTKKEIFEKKNVVQAIASEVIKYYEKNEPGKEVYRKFMKYYEAYREESLLMEMEKIKSPTVIKKPKI